MKITQKAHKINLNNLVDVSVDVHKEMLCFYFEIDGTEYSDTCRNRTKIVEEKLFSYLEIARKSKRKNLRIICEATGQYHNILMRAARRLGCFTNLVSGESVAKFRIIESNDHNKTDQKDPRVICSLGKLNKVIKHRILPENYLSLRKLNTIYEECDATITRIKCKISRLLVELFCDYSFTPPFIYGNSGQALMLAYNGNPYRIVQDCFTEFCQKMKRHSPRIRQITLKRLWEDAQQSVLNEQPASYIDIQEDHLCYLMVDYQRILRRKQRIVNQMKEVLALLREDDPNIPPPTPGFISDKNLARFLAETGPLSDFTSPRQLMRYAGLNLKTRQSGQYQGQNKISKKGRATLRKVLQCIALPLVRRSNLYGKYYHGKKDADKMPGNKAMTVVARKLLTKIYGWYRSGEEFDQRRLFICKSEFNKLKKAA